jgi:regulatory protein
VRGEDVPPETVPPEAVPTHGLREEERAVDRAMRALARRDHSVASLRAKLDRAGLSESAQSAALGRLERAGYLDDVRYAQDRAALLAERGYGDGWIRADLERQGVAREAADSAIAALAAESERALREAAEGGGGMRGLRSLARRGFSEDALEAVTEAVVAQDAAKGVGYEGSI